MNNYLLQNSNLFLRMRMYNKAFLKSLKYIGAALLTTQLIACGGTGQDQGTASNYERNFEGLAIDGYLARATVFLDTNNDGARNAWEPFAFTDDMGYFSYNPITDTDYCAANATTLESQYCLNSPIEYSNVVLRIDGGYDILTGEPFVGQMSRRLADASEESLVVSPLTTLMTDIESSADQAAILSNFGLVPDDLDLDYLNTDGAGEVNENIFNAAIKVHKVVAVLADRLTDTYTEIGEEVGTPNDATSIVYRELANQLLNSDISLNALVETPSLMVSVLDRAETALRDVYTQLELDLPADMGDGNSVEGFNRVIAVSENVVDIVDILIPRDVEITSVAIASGQARALESVVVKALNEVGTDISIENAVAFFTNPENADLAETLVESLAQDNADLSGLANNDFSGSDFDSTEEIEDATTLADDAEAFSGIAGFQIKVSDLDLGSSPNDLSDSEIEWYFDGVPSSIQGEFSACVKYISGANIDGTLGEGNTRGELVSGNWSLLGASEENNQSYSLLVTITFLGTTYQAILKPNGSAVVNNVEYQVIRFDNDNEISNWHSEFGFIETESIPTTNAECEARLPSRVGL